MGRNELSANAIAASTHLPYRCSENVFTYRAKRLRVTGATISPVTTSSLENADHRALKNDLSQLITTRRTARPRRIFPTRQSRGLPANSLRIRTGNLGNYCGLAGN